MKHTQLGAKGKKLIGRTLLEEWVSMSVTSGHAIGNAYTASYHVSRSLLLGKHMETWIRSDLLPPHGDDALV